MSRTVLMLLVTSFFIGTLGVTGNVTRFRNGRCDSVYTNEIVELDTFCHIRHSISRFHGIRLYCLNSTHWAWAQFDDRPNCTGRITQLTVHRVGEGCPYILFRINSCNGSQPHPVDDAVQDYVKITYYTGYGCDDGDFSHVLFVLQNQGTCTGLTRQYCANDPTTKNRKVFYLQYVNGSFCLGDIWAWYTLNPGVCYNTATNRSSSRYYCNPGTNAILPPKTLGPEVFTYTTYGDRDCTEPVFTAELPTNLCRITNQQEMVVCNSQNGTAIRYQSPFKCGDESSNPFLVRKTVYTNQCSVAQQTFVKYTSCVTNPTTAPVTTTPTSSPVTANPTFSTSVSPTTTSPSKNPSSNPSKNPTRNPSKDPSMTPSRNPTRTPTTNPTTNPTTKNPTNNPTRDPTKNPTATPTTKPSNNPTRNPTSKPSQNPTRNPTKNPTQKPTDNPTHKPTLRPSKNPTSNPTSVVYKLTIVTRNSKRAPTNDAVNLIYTRKNDGRQFKCQVTPVSRGTRYTCDASSAGTIAAFHPEHSLTVAWVSATAGSDNLHVTTAYVQNTAGSFQGSKCTDFYDGPGAQCIKCEWREFCKHCVIDQSPMQMTIELEDSYGDCYVVEGSEQAFRAVAGANTNTSSSAKTLSWELILVILCAGFSMCVCLCCGWFGCCKKFNPDDSVSDAIEIIRQSTRDEMNRDVDHIF